MKIDADGGFLPGLFGRRLQRSGSGSGSSSKKLQPKPHDFWKGVPHGIRNEFLAMSGEFVGTFMFLFLAFAGTQIANTPTSGDTSDTANVGPNISALMFIALSFGFSLTVNAWVFFRVTGGLFNPAVTLGLCLIGAIPFSRGALVFIAQLLGAMASAGVVRALFPGPLVVTTTLSSTTNAAQGVFIEMFLTAQLVFTIFMLAAEKHKSTFLAPVGIGLSLFVAELGGVYYTGGSLNPARSFGPCVALASFPSDHWVYWVGPLLGSLVASGFFWFIKSCEYETVNPGQDFDDLEAATYDPDVDLTRPVVMPTTQAQPSRISDAGDSRMDELMEGKQPQMNAASNGDYREQKEYSENRDSRDRPDSRDHRESRNTSNTYTIQAPNGRHSRDGPYMVPGSPPRL